MMLITRRRFVSAAAAVAIASVLVTIPRAADKLPQRLTDQEFWKIASEFSEPDGTFHSENLVSNESRFQTVIPALVKAVTPGRAYIGVGSEQNFTYMAAVRPSMAFIVDIRRGNLDLHLIYKALFEMSADRAEFVSHLFSRKQPAGLTATSSAADIFAAYDKVPASQALYDQNLKAIKQLLTTKHGFKLSAGDLQGVDFVYSSWFKDGPDIHYELTNGFGRGGGFPTYADLMTTNDGTGRNRSYLASEDSFKFLKDLEARNLVVPVVGNFGGSKALRAVAEYLKQKDAVVSTFYVSNVEQYLRQDNLWGAFCANVATFPLDATSTFIRSMRGGFGGQRVVTVPGFAQDVSAIRPETASCATSGASRR